jgi:hypothetical protein
VHEAKRPALHGMIAEFAKHRFISSMIGLSSSADVWIRFNSLTSHKGFAFASSISISVPHPLALSSDGEAQLSLYQETPLFHRQFPSLRQCCTPLLFVT